MSAKLSKPTIAVVAVTALAVGGAGVYVLRAQGRQPARGSTALSQRAIPRTVLREKLRLEEGENEAYEGKARYVISGNSVRLATPEESEAAEKAAEAARATREPASGSQAELDPDAVGDADKDAAAAGKDAEAAGAGDPDRPNTKPGEPQGENEILNGPSTQQVDARAYPRTYLESRRAVAARRAYQSLPSSVGKSEFSTAAAAEQAQAAALEDSWEELGPRTGTVPAVVTYTGAETTTSGRVTAMAIAPTCTGGDCRLYVAAAGGGIWRTDDALADPPVWQAIDTGLTTNTFGSIVIDPNNPDVIYAGSGEPNGSSDSEAGLGLFRSTDGGDTWSIVPGSVAVAKDRSIATILLNPNDSSEIRIGTALARHGSSSVNGGRRTPPGAPDLGIYLSDDGGATFIKEFSQPESPVPPESGQDYFQGSVTKLVRDPNDSEQVYASITAYGIFRHGRADDTGADAYKQIYTTQFQGDPYGARLEFDLADTGTATRIYLGDSSDYYACSEEYWDGGCSILLTLDDVGSYNADVLDADSRAPTMTLWQLKSKDDVAETGAFSSLNFCQQQCGYDMFVVADPNNADVVWLGGAMNYPEIFYPDLNRSNGRAVIRSTDGGNSFTDMTNDIADPPQGMHPDQHALVMNPSNTSQVFVGSDGGVVRLSGNYAQDPVTCDSPPLDPADVPFCQAVRSVVPTEIKSLNDGLNTLQFQSLSLNSAAPYTDVMGGTQDNGTWLWDGAANWFESVGGDGGQSGFTNGGAARMHTYYGPSGDVNFANGDPLQWAYVTGPMDDSSESFSFYVPFIADPVAGSTWYMGGQSVWRTTDNGGPRAYLEANCLEVAVQDDWWNCGDFTRIGTPLGTGSDYIVALSRSASDSTTMWAGLRYGELFLSDNINAQSHQVAFAQLSDPILPGRFVSGIAVDPADPHHAFVSYSGYSAYTPTEPGHVFELRYEPATSSLTTVRDISYNLEDQPVTGLALDSGTGDLYISTDFGVARLPSGATTWAKAADGLPFVATYGITQDSAGRVLYAATHGRGAYRVGLPPVAKISGPATGTVGVPVTFTSTGSAGYQATNLNWRPPTGGPQTTPDATFTPTTSGVQTITLTVTDGQGHAAVATANITVAEAPVTPPTTAPPTTPAPTETPTPQPVPPLNTRITAITQSRLKNGKVRFHVEFSANQPGARFSCKISQGSKKAKYSRCKSPDEFSLKPGTYTFRVRAKAGGVTDPTPAKVKLIVRKKSVTSTKSVVAR